MVHSKPGQNKGFLLTTACSARPKITAARMRHSRPPIPIFRSVSVPKNNERSWCTQSQGRTKACFFLLTTAKLPLPPECIIRALPFRFFVQFPFRFLCKTHSTRPCNSNGSSVRFVVGRCSCLFRTSRNSRFRFLFFSGPACVSRLNARALRGCCTVVTGLTLTRNRVVFLHDSVENHCAVGFSLARACVPKEDVIGFFSLRKTEQDASPRCDDLPQLRLSLSGALIVEKDPKE